MTDIKFGTDGFRGIIAREFTFDNVEKITTAIVKYLNNDSTVLVGYDPRFMADRFAKFCSEILAKSGHKVLLSSRVCPTPVLAYNATIAENSGGAIMFTASHNPCEYLGMKFIPNYGGPATVEITDAIVKNLDAKPQYKEGGSVELKDFSKEYFEHIEKLIDLKKIASSGINILYDGLYSASVGYFDELLKKHNINFESVNTYYDPLFGGGLPEPTQKYMKNSKPGFITLSNDGDGDRYGVIDEEGNWVSPNVVMAMLLRYLAKRGDKGAVLSCLPASTAAVTGSHASANLSSPRASRIGSDGVRGKLIKTVGASSLLDICAEKLGIETVTTPVGFKWVGEAMRENETILAGEDSGGLSVGAHIPEKDGIFANLLILEMLANEDNGGKTLKELQAELKSFAGVDFKTDRVDIKLDNIDKIKEIKDKFLALSEITGLAIKETLKIDGIKLFLADNASWILIRESGTEPLLRFYIESDSVRKIENIKEFIRAIVSQT